MITVTVKRSYYDATHYGTDEKGILRVYRSDEVIAEYEAADNATVKQEAPLFSGPIVGWPGLYGS